MAINRPRVEKCKTTALLLFGFGALAIGEILGAFVLRMARSTIDSCEVHITPPCGAVGRAVFTFGCGEIVLRIDSNKFPSYLDLRPGQIRHL